MNDLNLRQKCAVIMMDLMLLSELCFSVYMGQQHPSDLTAVFMKTFVPAAALTVICARIAIRKLRSPAEAPNGQDAPAAAEYSAR